jgi:hypothetical protein
MGSALAFTYILALSQGMAQRCPDPLTIYQVTAITFTAADAGTLALAGGGDPLRFDNKTHTKIHGQAVPSREIVRAVNICYRPGTAGAADLIDILDSAGNPPINFAYSGAAPVGWDAACKAAAADVPFKSILGGNYFDPARPQEAWASASAFPAEECRVMGDGGGHAESLRCEFPNSKNLFEALKANLKEELNVVQFRQTRDQPPKLRAPAGDCEVTITDQSDPGVIEIRPRQ